MKIEIVDNPICDWDNVVCVQISPKEIIKAAPSDFLAVLGLYSLGVNAIPFNQERNIDYSMWVQMKTWAMSIKSETSFFLIGRKSLLGESITELAVVDTKFRKAHKIIAGNPTDLDIAWTMDIICLASEDILNGE